MFPKYKIDHKFKIIVNMDTTVNNTKGIIKEVNLTAGCLDPTAAESAELSNLEQRMHQIGKSWMEEPNQKMSQPYPVSKLQWKKWNHSSLKSNGHCLNFWESDLGKY